MHYLNIFILSLLFVACGTKEEEIVRQKAEARVLEFSKKEKAKCRESLLRQASTIVDSMLLAEAQQQLRDSLNLKRPYKPVQPPNVPPIDSLDVKPIFVPKNN